MFRCGRHRRRNAPTGAWLLPTAPILAALGAGCLPASLLVLQAAPGKAAQGQARGLLPGASGRLAAPWRKRHPGCPATAESAI